MIFFFYTDDLYADVPLGSKVKEYGFQHMHNEIQRKEVPEVKNIK